MGGRPFPKNVCRGFGLAAWTKPCSLAPRAFAVSMVTSASKPVGGNERRSACTQGAYFRKPRRSSGCASQMRFSELSTQHRAYHRPWIKTFAVKLKADGFERRKLAGARELKGAFERSGLGTHGCQTPHKAPETTHGSARQFREAHTLRRAQRRAALQVRKPAGVVGSDGLAVLPSSQVLGEPVVPPGFVLISLSRGSVLGGHLAAPFDWEATQAWLSGKANVNFWSVAGVGIEPTLRGPKPRVRPLNEPAVSKMVVFLVERGTPKAAT